MSDLPPLVEGYGEGRGTPREDGTHCSAYRERGRRWLPSPQGVQLLGVRLLEVRRTQPKGERICGAGATGNEFASVA